MNRSFRKENLERKDKEIIITKNIRAFYRAPWRIEFLYQRGLLSVQCNESKTLHNKPHHCETPEHQISRQGAKSFQREQKWSSTKVQESDWHHIFHQQHQMLEDNWATPSNSERKYFPMRIIQLQTYQSSVRIESKHLKLKKFISHTCFPGKLLEDLFLEEKVVNQKKKKTLRPKNQWLYPRTAVKRSPRMIAPP